MINFGFANRQEEEFPQMVQLAINNICNQECNYCPHSSFVKEKEYIPKSMPINLHNKIANEVANYPDTTIRYLAWGEPMLYKNLASLIKYSKQVGVGMTNLITNGTLLDEQNSTQLILAGLDVLEVSVNANSPKVYKLIGKKEEDFEKVKNNVLRFIKMRDAAGGHTYVSVSIIDQPEAISEIPEFMNFWKDKVDRVILRTYHDFQGNNEGITLPQRYPCRVLWSRLNINYNGLVSICYNDWHNVSIMGDLNQKNQSIKEIWQSEEYSKYRKSHLDGKPIGICSNCNDWIGASWTLPYEHLLLDAKKKINERIKHEQIHN